MGIPLLRWKMSLWNSVVSVVWLRRVLASSEDVPTWKCANAERLEWLHSWVKNGNKLITSPTLFKKSYFEPTINNEMIATLRDVENAQHVLNTILLDARSKERYEGISDPVDPIAGHVPGAISHPLGTNLDRTGKFKDKEELKHNFDKISHDLKEKEIISMCGSGITACHNILALEIAGIKNAKLYVGSWSEWITDPNRTVVTIKSS